MIGMMDWLPALFGTNRETFPDGLTGPGPPAGARTDGIKPRKQKHGKEKVNIAGKF